MLITLVTVPACRKEATGAAGSTAKEIAPTIEKAFTSAPAEMQKQASEVVVSVQHNDSVKAFIQLQDLNQRENLTAEQRTAAARVFAAVMQQLQSAAKAGDTDASKLLEAYRKTK